MLGFKNFDYAAILSTASEIGAIQVVGQREGTVADRNARSTSVASFPPGGPKNANLGSLLGVERLTGFIEQIRKLSL
jgi:hypothetical protein